MENKIFININCPDCGSAIRLGKAVDARSLSFRCPGCRKIINTIFDISTTPQRVKVTILTPEQLKQMQAEQARRKMQQQPMQDSGRPLEQNGASPAGSSGSRVYPVSSETAGQAKAQPLSGGMNNTIYNNRKQGSIPKPIVQKPLQPHKTTPAMRGLSLVRQSILFWNKVSYPLIIGHNYIGRRHGNIRPDISIDEDDCISRGKSVDIEIIPGGPAGMTMTLKVIHSSNDVVINGSASLRDNQSMEVRIGDQIKIGKTTFKIEKQD